MSQTLRAQARASSAQARRKPPIRDEGIWDNPHICISSYKQYGNKPYAKYTRDYIHIHLHRLLLVVSLRNAVSRVCILFTTLLISPGDGILIVFHLDDLDSGSTTHVGFSAPLIDFITVSAVYN